MKADRFKGLFERRLRDRWASHMAESTRLADAINRTVENWCQACWERYEEYYRATFETITETDISDSSISFWQAESTEMRELRWDLILALLEQKKLGEIRETSAEIDYVQSFIGEEVRKLIEVTSGSLNTALEVYRSTIVQQITLIRRRWCSTRRTMDYAIELRMASQLASSVLITKPAPVVTAENEVMDAFITAAWQEHDQKLAEIIADADKRLFELLRQFELQPTIQQMAIDYQRATLDLVDRASAHLSRPKEAQDPKSLQLKV